jgi:arabinogalactan oligomer/maltooligosaccharide transport system permease protein
MEAKSQKPKAYHPETGWDRFSNRFRRFPLAFAKASPYEKTALSLNLVLPGWGDLLLGRIESGLITFLVSAGLWALGIYSARQALSGAITLDALTIIVYYLAILIGLFALYLYSFDSPLSALQEKEQTGSYPKFLLLASCRKGIGRIKADNQRFSQTYHSANSKGKCALLLAFFVLGVPEAFYKQFLRFLVYFASQVFFIVYFILRGAKDLHHLIHLNATTNGAFVYGIIAIAFLVAFVMIYFHHLKDILGSVESENHGKTPLDFVGECSDLANDHFYVLSLFVPIIGALAFTVIPLVFMILTAFTNYSLKTVAGYANYNPKSGINIVWTGFQVFGRLFAQSSSLQDLISVFAWTMIWAVLATFTCYFGGLFLAMLLNKKCIKGKIVYRSLFVIAMALPQFVSLLVVRTMFSDNGPINALLKNWGWIENNITFWETPSLAKTIIIVINMWVGIPYYMLLMSGLLLNIPKDQYEAADIEGANSWQRFTSITFPEIFYMTTPLLITSFVSNINNFNVIYFLNGGGDPATISGTAGSTDILITWLYKLTFKSGGQPDYNLAAALGIIMFLISASVSLIVFRRSKAYQQEEEFR